jgi:hypothetical protein
MITVSALCRFRPSPPARVERRNAKNSLFSALKFATSCGRMSAFVLPSRRSQRN